MKHFCQISFFTVAVCLILLAVCFAMKGSELISVNGLLWSVNMLIIAVVGLSMSFLIGSLVKNRSAQSAVANTVGLGLAFLSGCFVPQSLLSNSVLSVARFFPGLLVCQSKRQDWRTPGVRLGAPAACRLQLSDSAGLYSRACLCDTGP